MSKVESFFSLGMINLNRDADVSLYRQLYQALREAILDSRLKPGTRLPPTRVLAKDLAVSRNTIVFAFEQLISEGYLEGKVGAGSFVTSELPEELLAVRDKKSSRNKIPTRSTAVNLSLRGSQIAKIVMPEGISLPVPFRSGVPALDEFPFSVWTKLTSKRLKNPSLDLLCNRYDGGYRPLQEAIASYLGTARGVCCQPEQVIIVNGAQQAFRLIAQVLTNPGDDVFLEDPCYPNVRRAFIAEQLNPVPIPVDDQGIRLAEEEIRNHPNAQLLYTTPSYQFPLGVVMGLPRRLQLLEAAREHRFQIIEDDYDSEYRYRGRPLSALQGLDQAGRVIYVGTFSKVMFPSLRIGYLIAPERLIDVFTKALIVCNRGVPAVSQAILADFITAGHFARHIRRMRLLYAERQAILIESIREKLDGFISVNPADSGLNLVGRLSRIRDVELSERLKKVGIVASPVSAYYSENIGCNGLMLGYAGVTPGQIRYGVNMLEKTAAEYDF